MVFAIENFGIVSEDFNRVAFSCERPFVFVLLIISIGQFH